MKVDFDKNNRNIHTLLLLKKRSKHMLFAYHFVQVTSVWNLILTFTVFYAYVLVRLCNVLLPVGENCCGTVIVSYCCRKKRVQLVDKTFSPMP